MQYEPHFDVQNKTFKGYYRSNSSVGTANYWLVVPMVFCENRNIEVMREAMLSQLGFEIKNEYTEFTKSLVSAYQSGRTIEEIKSINDQSHNTNNQVNSVFPNIDGIKFLTHQGGCGGIRQDANALCGLLAGYITHPNVAGATVLSLGCQNAQVEILMEEIKKREPQFDKPLYVFDQQQTGKEDDMIANAIKYTFKGLIYADTFTPQESTTDNFCVGIEIADTDDLKEKIIGLVTDKIIALGGTVIFSAALRFKEIVKEYNDKLMNSNDEKYFFELVNKYEVLSSLNKLNDLTSSKQANYYKRNLILLGSSRVSSILDYPEQVTTKGLNLLFTSDNRVEAVTALAGSGATIILSAEDAIIQNPICSIMNIKDFIKSDKTIEQSAADVMEAILMFSGNHVNKYASETNNNFIPWRRGISL